MRRDEAAAQASFANASISVIGAVVPYAGDLAKGARLIKAGTRAERVLSASSSGRSVVTAKGIVRGPELAGTAAGAGVGYYHTGTLEGTLRGATAGGGAVGLGRLGVGVGRIGVNGVRRYRAAQAATVGTPQSLAGIRDRIDAYGRFALAHAAEKGLRGTEAGRYADRYFTRAVEQLNRRLIRANSPYRVHSQYGRNANGDEFFGGPRLIGTRFLDAALTDVSRRTVYSGWDITFHGTTRPRWNRAADNGDYLQFFQIQEGIVREIANELTRPAIW